MAQAEGAKVRRRDGVAVIDMPSQIEIGSEATLDQAYEEAGGKATLVLNFAGTEYINSSGIALIVGILARARKEGRSVAAYGLSEHYREIFEITRLADFVGMYPDEQSAITGQR
jgi:anti-anti-sigma factor